MMCSKSCAALDLLKSKDISHEVINYMNYTVGREELKSLLQLLKISAFELLRKKEPLFEQQFKDLTLNEEQWIEILVKHPALIERPIIIKGDKAIIGRPIERLIELLDETP